jgi:CubicO group peptidase (beta-lactamase class C family)
VSQGLSEQRLKRLHDVLGGYVESGLIPGYVALIRRGEEMHVGTRGTFEAGGAGAPMRPDTIFRMASTTKAVTATAAMILVEECRLRLDDAVDEWLPELAERQVLKRIDGPLDDTVPAGRPITVRDLLTFTNGFGMVMAPPGTYPIQVAMRELGIGSDGEHPKPEPDEWIRRLGSLPLMCQPGERWLYNTGADILGVLIARVSGQPFEEFLRQRIFEPLEMADTGFHVPPGKLDRLPTSYAHDPETGELVVWDPAGGGQYSEPPAFPAGGSGLASTALDYDRFYRMLLNGGERILSRRSVELMTMDHLTPAQKSEKDRFPEYFGHHGGWGFVMAVRTHRRDYASVGQFGWSGGLGTTTYADPAERLTGILLTQAALDTPTSQRPFDDFWTLSYQTLDG